MKGDGGVKCEKNTRPLLSFASIVRIISRTKLNEKLKIITSTNVRGRKSIEKVVRKCRKDISNKFLCQPCANGIAFKRSSANEAHRPMSAVSVRSRDFGRPIGGTRFEIVRGLCSRTYRQRYFSSVKGALCRCHFIHGRCRKSHYFQVKYMCESGVTLSGRDTSKTVDYTVS